MSNLESIGPNEQPGQAEMATSDDVTGLLNAASTLSAEIRELQKELENAAPDDERHQQAVEKQNALVIQNANLLIKMEARLRSICELWLAKKILGNQGHVTVWSIVCQAVEKTVRQRVNQQDAHWESRNHFLQFVKTNILRCLKDVIRRRKEFHSSDSKLWTSLSARQGSDDKWQVIENMLNCIERLPDEERQVIERRYFLEETQRSIGLDLGMNDKQIHGYLERIYSKLKAEMAQQSA